MGVAKGNELARAFIGLADKFALSDIEAAALVGLSIGTVRLVRRTGLLPEQQRCRAAIEDFLARHQATERRRDLSLPERLAVRA